MDKEKKWEAAESDTECEKRVKSGVASTCKNSGFATRNVRNA